MRMRTGMAIAMVLLTLATAVPLGASPASAAINGVSESTYRTYTDYFAKRASMGTFQYYENRAGTSRFRYLDWYDDGCSVPLGLSWVSSFHNPCERHDFCYANNASTRLDRRGYGQKLECDRKFYSDMNDACNTWSWWSRSFCRGSRNAYYAAVRVFGRIS